VKCTIGSLFAGPVSTCVATSVAASMPLTVVGADTRPTCVSLGEHAITRQCVVISTSNLVEIINVGVDACGVLSRSAG